MRVRPSSILVLLVVVALAAGGCSRREEAADSLASLTIDAPPGDQFVASLELRPDRNLSVDEVEMSADPGLETEYLGFVTRCADLCGINPATDEEVEVVRSSVDGTIPFEVREDEADVHLLFRVEITDRGREIMEDAGCVVVRDVQLRDASGDRVSVRRRGFEFLWAVTEPEGGCLERSVPAR